ncbi:MAG: BCCT family transporter [Myxococcota bacterium]|nr:BCCT family transporter [Myxococcota bacterium]
MHPKTQAGQRLFLLSLGLALGSGILVLLWPGPTVAVFTAFTGAVFNLATPLFLLSVSGFLVLCLALAISPVGRRRLGPQDARPEFSTLSWLSMLFAAGMGTGLVVWGVAEPMTHMLKPPSDGSEGAVELAFLITHFHWGLHAWAIYGVGALVLAYFGFTKGTPYLPGAPIRSGFTGAWTGPVAWAADLLAVLAVTFGVAGSIGMGVMQLASGLTAVAGAPADSVGIDAGILLVLFAAYMLSAATGLDKGIKILSNLNMVLAIGLVFVLLFLGPTSTLLSALVTNLGDYLVSVPALSVQTRPFGGSADWVQGWTLVYFVWWIAWTPFVGIFIARISRGRTIREFVVGVLVCPTLFSIFWFTVLGGVAVAQQTGGSQDYSALLSTDVTGVLYQVLETSSGGPLLGGLATLVLFVFMVTSVDSATFVLGMLTSGGDLEPSRSRKLSWGIALAVMGGSFALVGDVETIKVLTIAGAIPFLLVLILQVVAFLRSLRSDVKAEKAAR